MAYAQWIIIEIYNRLQNGSISVKDAEIIWGKFHKNGDKDHDISASEVSKVGVGAGSSEQVSSCGRSGSASGAEGKLGIYDGDNKVCTVYWSCHWGPKANNFQIQDRNTDYSIELGTWNEDAGALGPVEVNITRKN